MTVIILGTNGMLGSMIQFVGNKLYHHLSIIGLSRNEYDIIRDDICILDAYIPDNQDCVIVNCIGAIPQKTYSDDDFKRINVLFPLELSAYCFTKGISLIHVSTNCVFSGKKTKCLESDHPDAEDVYGQTKRMGEPSYGLTIRCSIIGPERHSFSGLMEWFLTNPSTAIFGYTDSYWNGLTTYELSIIILERIQHNDIPNRIIHHYSENTITKYDLLQQLNQVFGKEKTIHPKENGIKFYTLSSDVTLPRKNISLQIHELYSIYDAYKLYYKLK
jgi:dTDP-4-dehydrorhamnose reductase